MLKTANWSLALLAFMSFIGCSGCPKAILNGIQPSAGVPRQILAVDGDRLDFASVVWDAGLGSEATALSTFFSARYFQIPSTAGVGSHPVRLERGGNLSDNTVSVTVNALSGTWPAPRVEDVGLSRIVASGGSNADVWLTVSVANVDPDATVSVNGVNKPSIFTSAITHDKFNTFDAATFAYPVYHYGLLWVLAEIQPLGSTLNIVVTNKDGQTGSYTYALVSNIADADSDNDGLLDTWETSGYPIPGGGGTIDLAAMGCDPHRKDILVETDWIAAAVPNNTIWATIEAVFATAPVLNPNGSQGISIHIDRGQGAPFTQGGTVLANHTTMDFGVSATPGYVDFYTYKNNAANFDPARLEIFHYGIFGWARPGNSSGRGEIWGNDFMVTFAMSGLWGIDIAEVGTFIHELGHNIGLRHGGIDNAAIDANLTLKPNQESTMNYRYQFGGVSTDCNFGSEGIHTYSMGMYRTINEVLVNESIGICNNTALDMNGSSTITTAQMNVNASPSNTSNTDVHRNYNEWGNLRLNFRATGSRWLEN